MKKLTGTRNNRVVSALIALAMVATLLCGLLPLGATRALAAEIEAGATGLKVTDGSTVGTLIGFAGEEWYVVGDGTTGIYKTAPGKSITLLVKGRHPEGDDRTQWTYDWSIYGGTHFRMNWMYQDPILKPDDMTQFSGDNYWYKNNPGGAPGWTNPYDYLGSTLQQRMEEIAGEYGISSPREYALILARTLTPTSDGSPSNWAAYGMKGADVANQKLWPISYYEWAVIANSNVRSYTVPYWFRSAFEQGGAPYGTFGFAPGGTMQGMVLGPGGFYNGYWFSMAARPALNLNLTNALFTSEASANGKPAANIGDGLVAATSNTGAKLKFTMIDPDTGFLNLRVPDLSPRVAAPGGTVGVDYDSAIVDAANKYVSCVITDDSDNVLYYGKLTNTADGTANIPLPADMPIGSYKIKLFNEQVNGDNYTDFSSTPIEIPLTVASTPITRELTFETNGGGAIAPLFFPNGTIYTLTETTTKSGYNFDGWYADAALTIPATDVTMDGDKTVYAAWKAVPVIPPVYPTPTPTPTPTPDPDPDPDPTPTPEETPDPTPTPEETPTPTPTPEQPPVPNIPGDTVIPGDDEDSYIELDEDGTPQGEWHWDEDTGEWIYDEYPPAGEVPQTGDKGVAIYLPLFFVSVILLGIVVLTGKKKS